MDQAVSALRANGLTEFVLELVGEVYAAGRWPVQLPGGIITLEDSAAATSGNLYQKHITNPHTGDLVAHPPRQQRKYHRPHLHHRRRLGHRPLRRCG